MNEMFSTLYLTTEGSFLLRSFIRLFILVFILKGVLSFLFLSHNPPISNILSCTFTYLCIVFCIGAAEQPFHGDENLGQTLTFPPTLELCKILARPRIHQ